MERTYIALVEKDATSDYGVFFPDLPGCITAGTTFEEAREMAREALALHLEGMAADGEYIPPPCSADEALAYEDASYAIALTVIEALPERTEEEAQAEFEAFMASEEYHEIYGHPLTEEERLELYETLEELSNRAVGLKPIPTTGAEWTYAALVRQETGGDFGVSFPDLPGCIADGATLEEVCQAAREALGRHLKGISANGERIPNPKSAADALTHPDAADAIALTVVEARAAFDEFRRETAPQWEPDEAAMPAN